MVLPSSSHNLILASQSATRQQLLAGAGVEFEVRTADINESKIKEEEVNKKTSHAQIALLLAEAKAKQVSDQYPDAYVLGCDQLLSCSNHLLSKAPDFSSAKKQLLFLRGKEHDLISALAIAKKGQMIWRFIDKVTLAVRPFSDDFLDDYLSSLPMQALKSVGCYQLENLGIQLFSDIKGDYYTILGLPLLPLLAFLREQKIILS